MKKIEKTLKKEILNKLIKNFIQIFISFQVFLGFKVFKKYKYIISTKKIGRIDINEFCNKFIETNCEEDSKKIININPSK